MESNPPPSSPSVAALLDQLWLKFRPEIEDRASTLQHATTALAQGKLTPDLRAAAHSAAHKLVGSLGTFGLEHGSILAREAESILAGDSPIDSSAQDRLTQLAGEIRTIILTRP